ncbi:hypothetical protein BGZ63DRAFT_407302 [Mariannaea sp. PMI_226]|nr:hypothetical protein BGZ63DRAFT_407302 [Mariannaea sp. PMI_226]
MVTGESLASGSQPLPLKVVCFSRQEVKVCAPADSALLAEVSPESTKKRANSDDGNSQDQAAHDDRPQAWSVSLDPVGYFSREKFLRKVVSLQACKSASLHVCKRVTRIGHARCVVHYPVAEIGDHLYVKSASHPLVSAMHGPRWRLGNERDIGSAGFEIAACDWCRNFGLLSNPRRMRIRLNVRSGVARMRSIILAHACSSMWGAAEMGWLRKRRTLCCLTPDFSYTKAIFRSARMIPNKHSMIGLGWTRLKDPFYWIVALADHDAGIDEPEGVQTQGLKHATGQRKQG